MNTACALKNLTAFKILRTGRVFWVFWNFALCGWVVLGAVLVAYTAFLHVVFMLLKTIIIPSWNSDFGINYLCNPNDLD